MQRPLEALWRTFSNDRAKHWDSQDKHEAEALQGSNVDEAPDSADGSEIDFSTSRLRPRRMWIPRVIIVVFCCIIEAVLVIYVYEVGKGLLKSRSGLLTPVPEMPRKQILIAKDPLLSLPPSPEVDNAWASLIPTERGLIVVDNPKDYNLPPGLRGLNGEHLFGVTWTHQYHCVNMLRMEFWRLLRNESNLHNIDLMEDEDNKIAVGHHTHCFDYLRQTLMCNMDMTIEHAARSSKTGELRGFINGLDTEHTCRDRESVFEFMRDHAMTTMSKGPM